MIVRIEHEFSGSVNSRTFADPFRIGWQRFDFADYPFFYRFRYRRVGLEVAIGVNGK